MAEINGEEKRIGVSGEQIEEAVGKVPTIEADVKANKQNISALQTASAQHTADIARNTADIEKKANADEVYSREETDNAITTKVAEIVAGAPEEFDTLKEMSDWLTEHSGSAAEMNSAIQANTKAIADNATAIQANTAEIANNKSDILSVKNDVGSYPLRIADNNRRWLVLNLGNTEQFNHITISDLYGGTIGIIGMSPAYAQSDAYKTVKVIRYSYGDWNTHDATRFTVYNGEPNYKIREVYYNPNDKKHYIEIRGYTSVRVTGASVSVPKLVDYSTADVSAMTLIPESVYASKSELIALQERVTALETALSQT